MRTYIHNCITGPVKNLNKILLNRFEDTLEENSENPQIFRNSR